MVDQPTQFTRGTPGQWAVDGRILLDGQLGVARHPDGSAQVKVGNGSDEWEDLDDILVPAVANKVEKGALVFDAMDYGASASASASDNWTAIQAAIADAQLAAGARGATVLLREIFTTNSPVVLPRTGTTPTGVVKLDGLGPRVGGLSGDATFPAGRALIEWEDSGTRAWHQAITNMTLIPAPVAGCRAVHYNRTGSGTTLSDFNAERMQITMRDVLIEGHNGFNPSLVKIEGQCFYSVFERVYGDNRLSPLLGGSQPLSDMDTITLEFDSDTYGSQVSSDIVGLSYSKVIGVTAGSLRRGGRGVVLKGKVKATIIDSPWSDGTRYDPGLNLINCFNIQVVNANNEGRSGVQIRLKDCKAVRVRDLALSAQDPNFPDWQASTAYTTEQGVIVPGWRAATSTPAPANNNWYQATTAGTSGASQPTWPTTLGATVTDGTVVWTCMGPGQQDAVVIDGGDGITIDNVSTAPGLPNFTARGVKAYRLLNNPTNVRIDSTVPGNPTDEVAWQTATGTFGKFRGIRNGEFVQYGTDPFASGSINATKTAFYRAPKGSTATTRAMTQNTEYAVPIDIPAGSNIDRLGINVTTAAASGVIRLGVRADSGGYPGALILDAGTVDASTTGAKEITGLTVVTTGPRVWLVAVGQGASGIVATGINGPVWPVENQLLATAATTVCAAQNQTGVTGALGTFAAAQGTVSIAPLVVARMA